MKAVLLHDISKNYHGSLQEAANHIKAKMLIISSKQDHLVYPIPAIEFSKLLPAKLLVLNLEDGHVASNFSDPAMQKAIADELNTSN